MNEVQMVMIAIYGDPPVDGKYQQPEVAATERMMAAGLTPARATSLMAWVRGNDFWNGIVQSTRTLEKNLRRISGEFDKANGTEGRPYDATRGPVKDESLRPEQMFIGIKDPRMLQVREDLEQEIRDCEAQGIRGKALFQKIMRGRRAKDIGLLPQEVAATEPEPQAEYSPPRDPGVFDAFEEGSRIAEIQAGLPDDQEHADEFAVLGEIGSWLGNNRECGRGEYDLAARRIRAAATPPDEPEGLE